MFGLVRGLGLVALVGSGLLGAAGEAQAQRYYYYDDGRYDRQYGGDRFRGQRFYDPGYDIREPEYDDEEEELYIEPAPRRRTPRRPEAAVSGGTRQLVRNVTQEGPGTIVVDTRSKNLYLVMSDGQAMRYRIGVGREGFGWRGTTTIGRKAQWPDWRPPAEMRKRQPHLPVMMAGGIDNPLGARALYLHRGNKDTLYRIHGTNDPSSIGRAMSSGCFRMMNDDVIDLYERVAPGTRVVVL